MVSAAPDTQDIGVIILFRFLFHMGSLLDLGFLGVVRLEHYLGIRY
jgi:hypothetical protein